MCVVVESYWDVRGIVDLKELKTIIQYDRIVKAVYSIKQSALGT